MQRVIVDANVLLSILVHRNEKQSEAAKALLVKAEEGDIAVILPQFVIFEIVYVLQSTYRIAGAELQAMIRDLLALPGLLPTDDCPWKLVMELWPHPFVSLADAAIVAVATMNRYDAIATFDRKVANRLEAFGLTAYW